MNSHITITGHIEESVSNLKRSLDGWYVKEFLRAEFLIDDAKEVQKEAYIASDREKAIIMAADFFNIPSQNSLLKLLEEPPERCSFFIVTASKSALLPTVRSRLPVKKEKLAEEKIVFPLDIKKLELKDIFYFLKEHQYMGKDEAIKLIEALFDAVLEAGVPLKDQEIEAFNKACRLIYLNERAGNVFMYLLLEILKRKKRASQIIRPRH